MNAHRTTKKIPEANANITLPCTYPNIALQVDIRTSHKPITEASFNIAMETNECGRSFLRLKELKMFSVRKKLIKLV